MHRLESISEANVSTRCCVAWLVSVCDDEGGTPPETAVHLSATASMRVFASAVASLVLASVAVLGAEHFPAAPLPPSLSVPPPTAGGVGAIPNTNNVGLSSGGGSGGGGGAGRRRGDVAAALALLQEYELEFRRLKQQVLSFVEVSSSGEPAQVGARTDSGGGGAGSGAETSGGGGIGGGGDGDGASWGMPASVRDKLAAFEKQYRFEGEAARADAAAASASASSSSASATGGATAPLGDPNLFDFPNGGEGFHYVPSQYHHPPPPPLAPPPPPPPPLYGATHLNDFGSLSNFKTAPQTPAAGGGAARFQESGASVESSSSASDAVAGSANGADAGIAAAAAAAAAAMKNGGLGGIGGARRRPGMLPEAPSAMEGSVLANARNMRFQDLMGDLGAGAPPSGIDGGGGGGGDDGGGGGDGGASSAGLRQHPPQHQQQQQHQAKKFTRGDQQATLNAA